MKVGNEFVWIPCTLSQYQGAKNAVMSEKWPHDKTYETNGGGTGDGTKWSDNYSPEELQNINTEYGTDASEIISGITSNWENNQTSVAETSIGSYEGFYIARYEAGIPKEASFYTDSGSAELKYNRENRGQTNKAGLEIIKDLVPVSKKGAQAWNFITQPNAKIVAENMYKTGSSVRSYLVDLQAWNHICKNIYEKNTSKNIKDSTKWGNYYDNDDMSIYEKITGLWAMHKSTESEMIFADNYRKNEITQEELTDTESRIELATGSSDSFKNYNIYDMAGNMWEWTTGHNINNKTMFVVPRGRWVQ